MLTIISRNTIDFFQNIPAHQSQCSYIYKTFRADIPPASSVKKRWKNSNYRHRERGLNGFYRHKPWKQLVPILYKLQVDRDKGEAYRLLVLSLDIDFVKYCFFIFFKRMKPEEYPRETSCKYTNIVTGVLEYFERMNTWSGSLKSYL